MYRAKSDRTTLQISQLVELATRVYAGELIAPCVSGGIGCERNQKPALLHGVCETEGGIHRLGGDVAREVCLLFIHVIE